MTRNQPEIAEKLVRWANVGERGAPVAFVGREREIDLALRQLTTWQPGTSPGRTIVAQGAPGAGKTALLGEIGKRLPAVVPDAGSIYLPTPWIDDDVQHVLEELAVAMMGVPADAFGTTRSSETSAGVRAIATARHGEFRSVVPPDLTTWSAFRRHFGSRSEQARPTVLLVDEIQRIGAHGATTNLLHHLHDQTAFPLLLVGGGLSTSAARLTEAGLTRLDETHVLRIDALTLDEARRSLEESLRIMADDVGGITGHPDQWARRLAPPTHGWPQHVTCHFRAAAEALLASRRLAFDDANLQRALTGAQANRRRYYDRRLEASRTHPMIVHAIHAAIRRGDVLRTDAMAIVDAVRSQLGPYEQEEHVGVFPRASDCVRQMLHAGVIAYGTTATTSPLSIPIPSMVAHIASLLPRERREEVRRMLDLAPDSGMSDAPAH